MKTKIKNRYSNHRKTIGGAKRIFDTGAPFDTQFHGDLSKKRIQSHIDDMETKIKRLNEENGQAQKDRAQEQSALDDRRSKQEAMELRNMPKFKEINTKWYIFLLNGLASILKYILNGLASLLNILIFRVLGNILSLIFSMIKIVLSNYVIVGFILFCISIILILQFVFGYVVPLPGFVSRTREKDNIGNSEVLAEKKIDYQIDFFEQVNDFIFGIPNIFTNTMVNIRRLYQRFAKFFGNNDVLDLYLADRIETNAGRWDNIYNMELGSIPYDFENIKKNDDKIYTIIKPANLELLLKDITNLDIDKLPPSLQKGIKTNKEILKFSWDLDMSGSKYKLSCTPTDKNNNKVNIFEEAPNNECTIVKQYYENEIAENDAPKYYDIPTARYNKSLMLDVFVE